MTRQESIKEKVWNLAGGVAARHGYELVDVEYTREKGRWFVRVFIDKPAGVTLDDCEEMSRDLGDELDRNDFIPHAYILEVSSPGLERPLKRPEDYRRFEGRLIEVRCYTPVHGSRKLKGRLAGSDPAGITVEVGGEVLRVAWNNIAKANLAVEF